MLYGICFSPLILVETLFLILFDLDGHIKEEGGSYTLAIENLGNMGNAFLDRWFHLVRYS